MKGVRAPLRIGLAGAGWVTPHHLDAWAALKERAIVVAIADPDRTAADARAERYVIPTVYDSAEDMMAREQLDAIDIATPVEFHAPLCRAAARYGLAILCQKPLAPNLQQARALVAEIAGQTRLMVHENWRFRPHYRQARSWIQADCIGQVRSAAMTLCTSGLLPDASGALPALVRQPNLATMERMLLMEVMIHHVDTLRFLLGPLTLKGARLGKSCTQIRGEDRASLLLATAHGAAVSLLGDFMAHGYPPQLFDRLEILGTLGAISLRNDELRITGQIEEVIPLDLPANYQTSYRAALTHFLDRLADGAPFETSAEDNLATLEIMEAAYRVGNIAQIR
jgi:D-apiose dehydrogenase